MLAFTLPACGPAPSDFSAFPILYGTDDRLEITEELPEIVRSRAAAVGAIVFREQISPRDDSPLIELKSLGEIGLPPSPYSFCPGHRFLDQPQVAQATGVLITPHLLATAAHTFERSYQGKPLGCSDIQIVFGYYGQDPKMPIARENIYSCAQLRSFVPRQGSVGDYVFIELDRAVPASISPVPLSPLAPSDLSLPLSVFALGFPEGRMMKVMSHAQVKYIEGNFLRADTDTFVGNSGSPLFNENGELLGILSRGGRDYDLITLDTGESCLQSRTCDENNPCPRLEGYTSSFYFDVGR
jgi:hypothetical protein